MAEKKKILYIVEAMGGGVFTYIVDRAQEDERMEQIQRLRTEKNQVFQPVKKDTDNLQAVIDYYNNRRYQHRLFIQTPMQAHVSAMNRAA